MKVLIFAQQLEVGGTQTNAIELAAALRELHGFDVLVFATPGPAVSLLQQKGVRFVPAPEGYTHPSPARVSALRSLVRRERPDVIHAWDWAQCMDAYYGEHLLKRVPLVVSDMYMTLTRVLPKTVPTTFGTPELVDLARAAGRTRVSALLPPVDVRLNAPGAVDATPIRQQWKISPGDITLVSVSRLDRFMKAESLHRTIRVVADLGNRIPLRFVIVGDGEERPRLEEMAEQVNSRLKREAVLLAGQLLDPRPAYAAADIVIGMGGSALRGMAFGKPLIVVGERGFAERFNEQTADRFLYYGMYGVGDPDAGDQPLKASVEGLVASPAALREAASFGREFIVRHFSLEEGASRLAAVFSDAVRTRGASLPAALDGVRTTAIMLRERLFISHRVANVFRRGGFR